tara:strand:+ start:103288 stop:103689 length:402 start_codon:yes stop_codon:yes gene_type:complete
MTADRNSRKSKDPKRILRGKAAYRRGLRAEALATLFLCLKAYRIVGQRVRTKAGEIDLIVRRGNVLVFVEVKARSGMADAAEALGHHQRQRLARAASLFVATRPAFQDFDMRFDIVLVAPYRWPHHIVDAWQT